MMLKLLKYNLAVLCISLFLNACDSKVITSQEGTPKAVIPFSLTDVKLLDGPFKHATELNINSLLNYDPDRLLARFRIEAGLNPKAEAYGGWEAESLAGHSLGHHLSACALMYQSTGNELFKERANYIVNELAEVQQANGDGYMGAFGNGKNVFEEEIAKEILNESSSIPGEETGLNDEIPEEISKEWQGEQNS